MVFQQPNPFPMSIYENVVYGLRINGVKDKQVLDEAVEKALQRASIWDEVKDRLHDSAIGLSGGQQQRVFVLPVSWQPVLKSFSWMNRLQLWTLSLPVRLRKPCMV